MRDVEIPPEGSRSTATASVSDSGVWDMLGHRLPGADDPFSGLSSLGGATSTEPIGRAPAKPADVLDQLRREAEMALRDPDYVSVHATAVSTRAEPVSTQASADPLRSLASTGQQQGSLFELLAGPNDIRDVAERFPSLDDHELFAPSPVPDVLHLFAGDITLTRSRDIGAPLARREHHLVSMDSAYRPAQAQESDHDA